VTPEAPNRRACERRPVALDLWTWSLAHATKRLAGSTVDLSEEGALLRVPGLSEAAVRLEIWLALPDGLLEMKASVIHQHGPDLVGVKFDGLCSSERARLVEFLTRI
jgi:PilZ domain